MSLISAWTQNNLDIIFFIYGLTFVVMGLAILIQQTKGSSFKIAKDLWLLAGFGLTHGVNEWLDMWAIIKGRSDVLDIVRWFTVIISFFFLFEFGRRLFRSIITEHTPFKKRVAQINRFCLWWLAPLLGLLLLFISLRSYDFWRTGSTLSRYFLCFPGALVAGFSFFYYYLSERETLEPLGVKNYFQWAGLSIIAYGVLSGLVVPKGDFFPSNILNTEVFFLKTHLPVQVFRSVSAIIATLSIGGMLKIFNWETGKRYQDALEEWTNTFNSISDYVSIHDKDFRIIKANKTLVDFLGIKHEEIIGRRCYEVLYKQEKQCPNCSHVMMLESKQAATNEVDDPIHGRFFEITNSPIFNDRGDVVASVHYAKDVTERKKAEEALKESEERFRVIFESARDSIFIKDRDFKYSFVNPEMERVFGLPASEIIGMTDGDLFGEEVRSYIIEEDRRVLNGEVVEGEHTKSVKGVPASFHFIKVPIRDSSGNIVGICGIARDITERKHAEEKLRKREEWFRALTESTSDWIWEVNENAVYAYASPKIKELLGYEPEEMIGKTPFDLMPPEEAKRVAAEFCAIAEAQKAFTGLENINFHKNGRLVILETSGVPVFDANGNYRGYRGIDRDITERKKAEMALHESEEKFRSMTASANDPIIMICNDGRISYWNKAAEMIFGYTEQEAMDKELYTLIIPDRYQEAHRKGIEKFKETGQGPAIGKTLELEAIKRDGTEFPITLSISAVKVAGNWSAIGILRDFSERKQAEKKILHQIQKLDALHKIDLAITGSLDIKMTLDVFLEQVIKQLNVDAADVLLLNPHTQILEYAAGRGFRTKALQRTRLRLGDGHAGQAALEKRIVDISNLNEHKDAFSRAPLLDKEDFQTYFAAPLIAKGHVYGVLETFHRTPLEPESEWVDFLEALATQAAIAVDNASLFDNLQRSHTELLLAYDTTIEGWSHALDLRDRETEGHSQRVTEMTLKIALKMDMSEEELAHVRRGALLHDMGKIGVPDSILLKPDKLNDKEREIMQKHPVIAYEMLSPIRFLSPALDIPYCHHEWWDGSGYPRGLKEKQIPLSARIFAVVDVWDALKSVRPYRPAWPEEKVQEYLRTNAGTQFDPKVVEVFLNMEW